MARRDDPQAHARSAGTRRVDVCTHWRCLRDASSRGAAPGARWRRGLGLLLALALPSTVAASVDHYGLGNGEDGALAVATRGLVVNAYSLLSEDVVAGALVLQTSGTVGFASGDLVLLFQAATDAPGPDSGVQDPVDLAALGVSSMEYARVATVSGNRLELTEPLRGPHRARWTQLIRVPEYTEVTIADGGSVVPRAWDGFVGGVIAFMATGTIRVEGLIDASGKGFRGGEVAADGSVKDCADLDDLPPRSGSRGEGVLALRWGPGFGGRGNVANGGGGAACPAGVSYSAGAGGGLGGRGGNGGSKDRRADSLGGGPLSFDPVERVAFGGAGGAGSYRGGTSELKGGAGGGVVLLRGGRLEGGGALLSSGAPGRLASNQYAAASGGGAGGTIVLRLVREATVATVAAQGGEGGASDLGFGHGGGGGGAGGRIFVQASGITAATSASAGQGGAGGFPGAPPSPYESSAVGVVTLLAAGYGAPPVPTVTAPAPGQQVPSARFTFTGEAAVDAGVSVHVDGLRLGDTGVSAGGAWAYTAEYELPAGPHRVQASASWLGASSALSTPVTFFVFAVDAGSQVEVRSLRVGCGCAGQASELRVPSALAFAWTFGLALASRWRRRRRR